MTLSTSGRVACSLAAAALLFGAAGCQKPENANRSPQGGAPQQTDAGHPAGGPMMGGGGMMGGGSMPDYQGPTDGKAVALKLTGHNSAEELTRALAKLGDPAMEPTFDAAFRMAFSAKQAQRNYPDAIKLSEQILASKPNFAPAYRVLGYAKFNTADPSGALTAYHKAVEIDPNYGEAEYALAFMYAMSDQTEGIKHYRRAIELGVSDERDIGTRFYGLPKQP